MKIPVLLLFTIFSLRAIAQSDTIYTNNDKIACTVTEVTPDAIKFKYPGEDVMNSVYKNTVQKIVFKSGRVQTFAEATSYKTVKGADDYDNVTFTSVESEVHGLFKLGDVSSKAKGTTTLSSMEKVKERAIRKMKIQAAMMGANIVYLTQNTTTGNQIGTKYQAGKSTETNMEGVAYSNVLPNYNEFKDAISGRHVFHVYERDELGGSDPNMSHEDVDLKFEVYEVHNENGLTMIRAKMERQDELTYRLVSFNKKGFILVFKEDNRIYNFKLEF